jgi:3-oxoacyl-[acyl-carrier protein] reductase
MYAIEGVVMNLPDLSIIVTGAARGLGRCFAWELARAGAQVAVGDVDDDGVMALADEALTARLPGKIHAWKLDVSEEGAVRTFIAAAVERLGQVNGLVNNAGILRDGLLVAREGDAVRRLPVAQWNAVIATNLTGPFLMAREVAAHMLERGVRPGVIVNISSVTRAGNPGQSNYAAAKAGLDADTRTWALELAPHGIRVGGIAPGVVDTPILENLDAAHQRELFAKVPLGRIGRPEEMWLALRFILECDYFTGRVIDVDGGANF